MELGLGATLVHVLVDVALDCGPEWLTVAGLILVLLLLDLLDVLGLLDFWSICGRVWDAVYVAWVGGGLGFVVLLGLLLDVLLDFHLQLYLLLVSLLSWYDYWVGWWNGMHWLIVRSAIYRKKTSQNIWKWDLPFHCYLLNRYWSMSVIDITPSSPWFSPAAAAD